MKRAIVAALVILCVGADSPQPSPRIADAIKKRDAAVTKAAVAYWYECAAADKRLLDELGAAWESVSKDQSPKDPVQAQADREALPQMMSDVQARIAKEQGAAKARTPVDAVESRVPAAGAAEQKLELFPYITRQLTEQRISEYAKATGRVVVQAGKTTSPYGRETVTWRIEPAKGGAGKTEIVICAFDGTSKLETFKIAE
jgi:hypothetical protein